MTMARLNTRKLSNGVFALPLLTVGALWVSSASAELESTVILGFVDRYCAPCHGDELEGELDLWTLLYEPLSATSLETWIKVRNRAAAGEMPPEKKPRPEAKDLDTFLKSLSQAIASCRDGSCLARI